MTSTRFKLVFAIAVVVGAVTTIGVQHQSEKALREENESLRRQFTQLKADSENLSSLAARSNQSDSLPADQFNELLRLRGEQGVYRLHTANLARLQRENQDLLSKIAAQSDPANSDPTNQVSAEDRFILRQTHTVDAMHLLLAAVRSYTTNHNGQHPESLEQLAAAGDLGTNNLTGNLELDDFEVVKDGLVDREGNKVILRIRTPIQRSPRQSVIIIGSMNKTGVGQVEIENVNP